MAFEISQITDHPISSTIGAIRSQLLKTRDASELSVDVIKSITRLSTAIEWFDARLKQSDPLLLSHLGLNDYNELLRQTSQAIDSFIEDQSPGHLDRALQIIDQSVLPRSPGTLVTFNSGETWDLAGPLGNFQKATFQALEELASKVARSTAEAESAAKSQIETQSRLDKMRGEIDTAVSNFSNQFTQFQGSLFAI